MSDFPEIGTVFQERYRLDELIGQGGYAHVYRAHQLDLGREVAVKILRLHQRSAAKAEEARKRFQREAKLISQLDDPHTITVFDYGLTDDGRLYMITELVRGRNLHEVLREEGALDPTRVIRILLQVLYSLEEAHELGVLHRDLKPANVMLYDRRGRPDQVKLLDFGIAKAFQDDDDGDSMQVALTGQGRVMGSPGYMAPEQIRGQALDPRTDIYSLGLLGYEMLTGNRAIKAIDDLKAAFEQMDGEPIRLPSEVAPVELADVIHRMVFKDRSRRFTTTSEIIEVLSPLVEEPVEEKEDVRREMRKWQILAAILAIAAIAAAIALNI